MNGIGKTNHNAGDKENSSFVGTVRWGITGAHREPAWNVNKG